MTNPELEPVCDNTRTPIEAGSQQDMLAQLSDERLKDVYDKTIAMKTKHVEAALLCNKLLVFMRKEQHKRKAAARAAR